MTAQVIQFIPRPNPNRKSLEQQAAELLEQVDPVALRHQDTAPSEMAPHHVGMDFVELASQTSEACGSGMKYVAPPEDCA